MVFIPFYDHTTGYDIIKEGTLPRTSPRTHLDHLQRSIAQEFYTNLSSRTSHAKETGVLMDNII